MLNIEQVNQMTKQQYIEQFGEVFEHSPWIAEQAWEQRPFADKSELHRAMLAVVLSSSTEQQLALFRAHPNLATRIRVGDYSTKEQQGAGLDQLTQEEYEQFRDLNEAYQLRFGFPFLMAVKGKDKSMILAAMQERVEHTPEQEAAQALREIEKITRFRLDDLIAEEQVH